MSATNRPRRGSRGIARASTRAGVLAILSALILLVGQFAALAGGSDNGNGNGQDKNKNSETEQTDGSGSEEVSSSEEGSDSEESVSTEESDDEGSDVEFDSEVDSDSEVESDSDAEVESDNGSNSNGHEDSNDDEEADARLTGQGGGGGNAKITICRSLRRAPWARGLLPGEGSGAQGRRHRVGRHHPRRG
jgi:hypothetical protein